MKIKRVLELTPKEEATLWHSLDMWKHTMGKHDFDAEFVAQQEKNIAIIKQQLSKI